MLFMIFVIEIQPFCEFNYCGKGCRMLGGSSESHNLKYFGVTGLATIVEGHPQYATAHQLAVIECLEDDDETL